MHFSQTTRPKIFEFKFNILYSKYKPKNMGCCKTLRLNNANQQHPRPAAEPGQGRERMGGQFTGYIPANRAERFREALSEMSAMDPASEGGFAQSANPCKGAYAPTLM